VELQNVVIATDPPGSLCLSTPELVNVAEVDPIPSSYYLQFYLHPNLLGADLEIRSIWLFSVVSADLLDESEMHILTYSAFRISENTRAGDQTGPSENYFLLPIEVNRIAIGLKRDPTC
jgi:hypothetical protein